jgi:hypothetical protein
MTERKNELTKLFGLVTLAVCAAAIFDPRFREACLTFLCKLKK